MNSPALNEAQLSVLQLLAEPLTPEELEELRKMLLKFRYDRLQRMLEKQRQENNWTQETLDEWYAEHHRTPYHQPSKNK